MALSGHNMDSEKNLKKFEKGVDNWVHTVLLYIQRQATQQQKIIKPLLKT